MEKMSIDLIPTYTDFLRVFLAYNGDYDRFYEEVTTCAPMPRKAAEQLANTVLMCCKLLWDDETTAEQTVHMISHNSDFTDEQILALIHQTYQVCNGHLKD